MAGELTHQEQLDMTLAAIKNLRTQLFQQELHCVANALPDDDKIAALKLAITRLEQRYLTLVRPDEPF